MRGVGLNGVKSLGVRGFMLLEYHASFRGPKSLGEGGSLKVQG